MKVSICTAWKDMGDPDRRRGFMYTRRFWTHHFPDAELIVATPEPFTRARGLNAAIEQSTGDVIIQADPDSIVPVAQALQALTLASQQEGLVVPYNEFFYLDLAATMQLHHSPFDPLPQFEARDCQEHGFNGAGPITMFSRTTWDTAGRYDESFGLWGGDDGAFQYACDAYYGSTRRVNGPMLHSYHPRLPQSIPGGPGYGDQFVILAEYRDAALISPDAVKAIVDRRR